MTIKIHKPRLTQVKRFNQNTGESFFVWQCKNNDFTTYRDTIEEALDSWFHIIINDLNRNAAFYINKAIYSHRKICMVKLNELNK